MEVADFVSEQTGPNEPLPDFCHALTGYEYNKKEKVLRISRLSIKMKKNKNYFYFSIDKRRNL